jgi:hypothetical protein
MQTMVKFIEKANRQIEVQKTFIENLKRDVEEWQEKTKEAILKQTEADRELSAVKDVLASKRSECERLGLLSV